MDSHEKLCKSDRLRVSKRLNSERRIGAAGEVNLVLMLGALATVAGAGGMSHSCSNEKGNQGWPVQMGQISKIDTFSHRSYSGHLKINEKGGGNIFQLKEKSFDVTALGWGPHEIKLGN
jgi:hypothetical protein